MGNLERRAKKRQGGRERARREKARTGKKGKRQAMEGGREGERRWCRKRKGSRAPEAVRTGAAPKKEAH